MKKVSDIKIREFVKACRKAAAYGLISCSSGNMSFRVDSSRMLIKARGAWMADITKDEVAVCRISDGSSLSGRAPSNEIGFHSGILRERPEVNVVLHFQAPFATALACSKARRINFDVIPEMPIYMGPVGSVPYLHPGSPELAKAVISVMRTHDMAIMRNHGQVTAGKSYKEVIRNAVFFEMACGIILRLGKQVQPLAGTVVQHLRMLLRAGKARA